MSAPKVSDHYYFTLTRAYQDRLNQTLEKIEQECEKEKAGYQSRIWENQNPEYSNFGAWGFMIGLACAIYACTQVQSFESFLIGGVMGFLAVTLLYGLVCLSRSSTRKRMRRLIQDAEEERDREKEKAKTKSVSDRENEYRTHIQKITQMSDRYYDQLLRSGKVPRIFNWLGAQFDRVVRNADHFAWIDKISPSITITVNTQTVDAQLSTTEYVKIGNDGRPVNRQPEIWKTESFNYLQERMTNPITERESYAQLCQRAAYARFLARVCKDAILATHPKDPNATRPVKPDAKVQIQYGEETVCLIYTATNTEYIPV